MEKKEFSPTWMYKGHDALLCLTQSEYDEAVKAGAKDAPHDPETKPEKKAR